ncbi:MAG TPA: biotin-dependent carboxyltransferase family protein [Rhodoblastus sp.]|nr:biotin-dependent carboxyltransferase family protein [Rhodoblastus sp.]
MSAVLRIAQAGPGVTLQDSGRWGYLRYGVTQAGPMDALAHEFANRMAGNAAGAAAIEISVGGLDAVVEAGALEIAVVAPGFRVARDGVALPASCLVTLAPGERLSVRAGGSGAWAYLAPAGGIAGEPELGSFSMHVRTGVGGAGLKAGDSLHIAEARAGQAQPRALGDFRQAADAPIRIVAGPQDDYFDAANFARFLEGPWRVAARSDRMAYALEGPRLEHSKGFNIVSDGIVFGAIQVPGDGWPFVQMADRAPTGGYPKIATVIAADLGRLAQMRPGATLRFSAVTTAQAVDAWRDARATMEAAGLAPQAASELTSEALLARNLVGGVVSAQAWSE